MLCTDMRQSIADYRFLATAMGDDPLFPISEGSLFENQTAHFVVFEPSRALTGAWQDAVRTFSGLSVARTL